MRCASYMPQACASAYILHANGTPGFHRLGLGFVFRFDKISAVICQVMGQDGSWEQLLVPEGHIAVLAGYTLERATCGLVKAVTHRVVRFHLRSALCASMLLKHSFRFHICMMLKAVQQQMTLNKPTERCM